MGIRLDDVDWFSGNIAYEQSETKEDGERVTGDTDE